MSDASVLFIEDDRGIQTAFAKILSGEGYEVHLAHRGEEGLEILDAETIDLVLLDIALPGIDGFETCRRIRAEERFNQIPILFLTAQFPQPNYTAKGLDMGGNDYMTKPIDPAELKARIRAHLRLKKAQEDLIAQNRPPKDPNQGQGA